MASRLSRGFSKLQMVKTQSIRSPTCVKNCQSSKLIKTLRPSEMMIIYRLMSFLCHVTVKKKKETRFLEENDKFLL